MPDLKAYLRDCIDSFFNKLSNRQLMSWQSFASNTDQTVSCPTSVDSTWQEFLNYVAPTDGYLVLTLTANTDLSSVVIYANKYSQSMVFGWNGARQSITVPIRKGSTFVCQGSGLNDIEARFCYSNAYV